jgi:PTS system nitrogen regulatory IIA component
MTTGKKIDFRAALESSCFALDLKSRSKEGIIEEMIDQMVAAGKLADKAEALKAVLERERKMSTGMQHGVAMPHGKTEAVAGMVTALALKPAGVDFGAMDGEPSSIFVMTVSSICQAGPHMEYLAEIGKILSRPSVRKRLLQAGSREDIIKILAE